MNGEITAYYGEERLYLQVVNQRQPAQKQEALHAPKLLENLSNQFMGLFVGNDVVNI